MDFKRARGEARKKIRIQQIVDAAAGLYKEIGYEKITFTQIGKKLNFTRLNLYNYYHCKEDIFLTLLLQDIWNMVADAEATFTKPVTDREAFCLSWAGLMLRHQRMLSLFSIVNTVILKNATEDMHRKFRTEMNEGFKRIVELTQKLFPDFTYEQALRFAEYENSYAMTLYPSTLEYKSSHNVQIFQNAGFGTRDFVSQYVPFLRILLKGLEP